MKIKFGFKFREAFTHKEGRLPWLLLLLLGALISLGVVSCASVDQSVVIPPQIPGATYVGSEACEECHQDIFRGFSTASHFRLKAQGDNAKNIGCESCHGRSEER